MRASLTRLRPALAFLAGRAALWPGAVSGVAAVEFALILPVMIALLLGMTEVTFGVNMDRKLTLLSRSLADLSSRIATITTSDLSNVFEASSAIMRPFDATSAQMVVTSVLVSQSGSTWTGTVDWSCGKNLRTKAATQSQSDYDANNLKVRDASSNYAVPAGFQSSTTKSFILVETLLPYTPSLGYLVTGTINLHETTPWPVRNNDKVTLSGGCPA